LADARREEMEEGNEVWGKCNSLVLWVAQRRTV